MTILNRALSAIGLMRVSEHEREIAEWEAGATRWQDKFKKAVTDLEKADRDNAELKGCLHYAEPRAIKWDNSLKRGRDRREAKKGVAS